jgi:hypothetical protein
MRGVSSKLGEDRYGRRIVTITSPSVGLPTGMVFLVRGNTLLLSLADAPGAISWLGRSKGRTPTPEERLQIRNTGARSRRAKPAEVPDELLEPETAIDVARREQQAAPADLISAVLPA